MKDIAAYLVKQAKKKGADDVVVNLREEQTTQLKFSKSRIVTTQTWDAASLNLFVAAGKRIVFTSVRDFSIEAADKTIRNVLRFAKTIPPDKEYRGIAAGPFHYTPVPETYDRKIASLGDACVDLLEEGIVTAEAAGAAYCDGVFEVMQANAYTLTSNNVEAEEKGTGLYCSFRAILDAYATGHMVENARTLKKFSLGNKARRAAEIAVNARNPLAGKAGVYDVVFEPLPFANLVDQFGNAASMFNVESGLSCLAGKIGTRVAAAEVTLRDDPCQPGGFGSGMFDDEGAPTQDTGIIEHGVLKHYLHNTSTAQKYKTKTTGNAGLVMPRPMNLVFEKGNLNKEELLAEIKKGLLITNVWYTRFQNHETGDFSTIPRDGIFLIKNGKVAGPVKEIRVSENLLALMKNVSAIGKDAEHVKGWENDVPVHTPPVLVKGVHITKSVE